MVVQMRLRVYTYVYALLEIGYSSLSVRACVRACMNGIVRLRRCVFCSTFIAPVRTVCSFSRGSTFHARHKVSFVCLSVCLVTIREVSSHRLSHRGSWGRERHSTTAVKRGGCRGMKRY